MKRLQIWIKWFLSVVFIIYNIGSVQANTRPPELLNTSRQLVLIIADSWDKPQGILQRFQRSDTTKPWQAIGESWPVVTGKSGLAWGDDFQALANGSPVKHEGDLKAPAGAYKIGPAFGFATSAPDSLKMAYIPINPNTVCVDDARSEYYGKIVDSAKVRAIDWDSGEIMSTVPVYRHGFVVDYNTNAQYRGGGSCIFIHLLSAKNKAGTHGCTAMEETFINQLWGWLNSNENPVLVQLPRGEYLKLQSFWNLPVIASQKR